MNLEALLSPISVPVFLDQYFGQEFLHVPGAAGKLPKLPPGALSDQEVPPALNLLAEELERALEAPVRLTLPPPAAAAGPQRLKCDCLVLQLDGVSEFVIRRPEPGPARKEKPEGPPAGEGVLHPGGVLYVPRHWRLEAAPGSLQARFDIVNPTGVDFLQWFLELAKRHRIFHADLPRFAGPAARSDYVTSVRHALGRMLRSPSLLETFRREMNFRALPSSGSGQPWSAGAPDDSLLVILAPRQFRVKRAGQETVFLVGMGKRLRFPQEAAPLLHYLSDHAPVRASDFYREFEADFDRDDLKDLLAALAKDGFVGVRASD